MNSFTIVERRSVVSITYFGIVQRYVCSSFLLWYVCHLESFLNWHNLHSFWFIKGQSLTCYCYSIIRVNITSSWELTSHESDYPISTSFKFIFSLFKHRYILTTDNYEKLAAQYLLLGLKLTTSCILVNSHNYYTSAPVFKNRWNPASFCLFSFFSHDK